VNAIWRALERPGDARAHLHCWEGGGYRPVTWDEWRRGAERCAAGLQARGVRPGMGVAAILTNTFDVCAAVIGAWMAGAMVLSLPTLRRGMTAEEYIVQLRELCSSSGAHLLLMEERFTELLDTTELGTPVASYASLASDAAPDLALLSDEDAAFVQYSSGSTSDPKGIVLSMGAIGRQEEMLAERLEVDGTSQGVMWLPLSHDMGLFGCVLLSWAAGMRLAVGPPERFLQRPQTWLDDAAEVGATITASPNFGLALATRRARRTPPKGSCPMRTVVLGGERIELATLDAAHQVLGPYGLTRETLTPAYGLAEGTLAVTMKRGGETPGAVWIDREAAYRGELSMSAAGAPGSSPIVSCGPPMPGVGVATDEQPTGRIRLTSASLASGYLNDPETTAARFVDGGFQTDDLGFVTDGELYPMGRTDDVIVIAGRNVHANDIERDIEEHEGVRPGCAALIDERSGGEPHIVLVAEPAAGVADLGALADQVAHSAFKSGGIHIAECVFVQPGQLPKTPSGKIQRFRCRSLLDAEGRGVLDRVVM
jgi:fatty-acyl-CoA synthase